ncbi:MAG: ATP-binding protein [Candidatus Binataceae bacterium]
MGLRAKLAIVFLVLLVAAILAVSALEIDHISHVMVADLGDSGEMLIDQTFEQMRPLLSRRVPDPAAALHGDAPLHTFLDSSQAFGRGVVYVRVENSDGTILAAMPASLEGTVAPPSPPFQTLIGRMSTWWPFARARALWGNRTYEMSRTVELNGRAFAVIRVGLSTGLIADEVRRSVVGIASIGAGAIVLGLIGVMLFGGAMMRPVIELTTSVEQLAAGRSEVKLRIGGHDELGTLAEKFNQLSQRIKFDRTQWENERGQFFNIFRSITDAVLLLDGQGMILFANAEAQGRLGLPAGGAADGKPFALLLGRDHPIARMVDTSYAVGTEVHDVALEMNDGDGGGLNRFLVSIFSLGRGPEPPGLLVIVRDLKPVQELENVVDYSGRLARLGGLISGVAHQIRNPLNAMSLQLELLSQDNEHGKHIDQRVALVRKEIRRLDQAVDALLRFMRPQQLKLDYVSLNDLLVEIASQVNRPGIRIEYHLDPEVPRVSADRALLSEALRNLAVNAVEAMPKGGLLTFGSTRTHAGMIELSVQDEGQGIPSEHLDRIFQLYFTTKEGGSGLGLSLASRAIDLHGGTVEVKSAPGMGTTIKVRLPTTGEQPARAPAALGSPGRA